MRLNHLGGALSTTTVAPHGEGLGRKLRLGVAHGLLHGTQVNVDVEFIGLIAQQRFEHHEIVIVTEHPGERAEVGRWYWPIAA